MKTTYPKWVSSWGTITGAGCVEAMTRTHHTRRHGAIRAGADASERMSADAGPRADTGRGHRAQNGPGRRSQVRAAGAKPKAPSLPRGRQPPRIPDRVRGAAEHRARGLTHCGEPAHRV